MSKNKKKDKKKNGKKNKNKNTRNRKVELKNKSDNMEDNERYDKINEELVHTSILEWFNEAKVPDQGEDADPLSYNFENFNVSCVFDGLGGAGSQLLVVQGKERTSAYHASREVRKYTEEFLNRYLKSNKEVNSEFINTLEFEIFDRLSKFNSSIKRESKLKSSLIKSLPTTISGVILERRENNIVCCHNFWAGDSRNYILNKNGLNQMTSDDLQQEFDAFQNLNGDSKMSNFVNADKPFKLNYLMKEIDIPSIVFSVTDGAFDYLPTPMDFEYLLLKCIESANSYGEFNVRLLSDLKEIPVGDDVSASFIFYGWDSFNSMKNDLAIRQYDLMKSFFNRSEAVINDLQECRNQLNKISKEISKKAEMLKDIQESYWKLYKENYHS